jgi:hypothetical protein
VDRHPIIASPGKWRVSRLGRAADATRLISRRVRGKFVPWVVAAPSCFLRRLGLEGNGLYAARAFQENDVIGTYGGTVVAPEDVPALVARGHDKIVVLARATIDGESQGPPYLSLMNDPRDDALETARLMPTGGVRAVGESVPYDRRRAWRDNGDSELLMGYGPDYWANHHTCGSASTEKGDHPLS